MMDQSATIEFDCGVLVENVGVVTMALRHHLVVCEDGRCRASVQREMDRLAP